MAHQGERRAPHPGSFDPSKNGHECVIEKIVLVGLESYEAYQQSGGCLSEEDYQAIVRFQTNGNLPPSKAIDKYQQRSWQCSLSQARHMAEIAGIRLTLAEVQMYAFLRLQNGTLFDKAVLAEVLRITDPNGDRFNVFTSRHQNIFPEVTSQGKG